MKLRRGAVLGFGNVAQYGHLPAWRQREDVHLVAVADPSQARRALAARLMPAARVYRRAEDALRLENLDFVDIAAPPAGHAPLAVAAAQRGLHVLCEKPLATSVGESSTAARAARAAGVALYTVHNWKYSEQFTHISELIAAGTIGTLRCVRIESIRSAQSATVGDSWRGRFSVAGGGILVDHGWHALYLMAGLVGEEPCRVQAVLERRRHTDLDVEDTATCTIQFPSVRGEIFLTWAGDERRTRWVLSGDEGSLELDGRDLTIHGHDREDHFRFGQSLAVGSHHPEWFGWVVEDFLRAMDGGPEREANLREAELCQALLALAYASAERDGASLAADVRTGMTE